MGGKTSDLGSERKWHAWKRTHRGDWSWRRLSYPAILVIQEGKRLARIFDHINLILGLGLRLGLNL